MKFFTTLRNRLRKNLALNQKGQGATEYILLLVVVVGLVMAFKKPITDKLKGKIEDVGASMEQIKAE